jgi:nucleoid DNA-binding protein
LGLCVQNGIMKIRIEDSMQMALTKGLIRQFIEDKLFLSRFESSRLIDSIMEIIKRTLESGEDVLIRGFREFIVRKKRNYALDKAN